jgi:hypothetical protein
VGRPPSCCTLNFTACFIVLHNTENNLGQAAIFTDTTFAKRELAVKTLRKVESVKTILSNTRFIQITKSNENLV